MATFANQSSNLSALSSALTSFSELLNVSDDAASRLTKAEDEENANLFLETQRLRVDAIDVSLLEATEDILPVSAEANTVTEMAELCRLVQEGTRQKMGLLRARLELLGVKTSWNDSITSPRAGEATKNDSGNSGNDNYNTQIQWSVGGPLDCVFEGDVETEGATTPGSMLLPSPLFGSNAKRKASLTPTTPTMKTFSFSSSTASILQKMSLPLSSSASKQRQISESAKASPSPHSGRRRSERHLNFEGFQEEDDMISLITQPETPTNNSHHNNSDLNNYTAAGAKASPVMKLKEERSHFLARMESMLERVEEELIHECRPSDETNGIVSRKGSSIGHNNMERPSNSKFLEEITQNEDGDDDSESVDDDSTNMIATIVAEKPEQMGKDIKRPVPLFHPLTHIVVDTSTGGAPSPSHTNITMDATMMFNDTTMISTSVMRDDDNDSTVTPILDRYRLDPDDNSIGVKVVPNERRGKHLQLPAVTTEFYTDSEGFMSPKGLPGSVSARKTKQYRKTPLPKKQLEHSFHDENDPNRRTLNFLPPTSTTNFDATNPGSSFSVPPLRPRSLGPTSSPTSRPTALLLRSHSLPAKATPLPTTPNVGNSTNDIPINNLGDLIVKISKAEYDISPKVVQMQVTQDQANQSIDALQDFIALKYQNHDHQPALEFSVDEGYRVLTKVLESEQKSKSVLMSLCHWKRLLMFRDSGKGMVFQVNKLFDE